MAIKPVRQLTEIDVAALDTLQVITLGMGWFFSLKGAVAVLVSVMLMCSAAIDLIFASRKTPEVVTSLPAREKLKPNDYVKLTASLDYAHAIGFKPVLGENFTLTHLAHDAFSGKSPRAGGVLEPVQDRTS